MSVTYQQEQHSVHVCQWFLFGDQLPLGVQGCRHCQQEQAIFSLGKVLRFSPQALGDTENREFVVYQLLMAILECLERAKEIDEIRLQDVQLGEDKWLFLNPQRQGQVDENEDVDLNSSMRQWCSGELSNFDYLMLLNKLAGRCVGDPSFHPMLPWVIDMTVHPQAHSTEESQDPQPPPGYRDLTKTKYRLMKGDEQLEHTYSSSVIPHHISDDDLSELTYCLYKARELPKSVLVKTIRSVFEPNEYPSSICRLYDTTPDECIPEFYTDPAIFYSVHDDLPDLQVPEWVQSPEEFVEIHREVLESEHVSSQLHHWIDLTFGYKLCGQAAISAKNVRLPRPDPEKLTTKGIFQLFQHPHPPKFSSIVHTPSSESDAFQLSVIEDYMTYQQQDIQSDLQDEHNQSQQHSSLVQSFMLVILQIISGKFMLDRRKSSINELKNQMPRNMYALIENLQAISSDPKQYQPLPELRAKLQECIRYFQGSIQQAYIILKSVQHLEVSDQTCGYHYNSSLSETLAKMEDLVDHEEGDAQISELNKIFHKLFIAEGIRLQLYEKFEHVLRSDVGVAHLCLPYLVRMVDVCLDSIFHLCMEMTRRHERFGVDRGVLFEEMTESLQDLMWELTACFQPWQISGELVKVVRRGVVASLSGKLGEDNVVLMNPKIHVVLLRTVGMATYIEGVLLPLLQSLCAQQSSTMKAVQSGKQLVGCMAKELENAVVIQQILRPLILRLGTSPQVAAILVELTVVNPDSIQASYTIGQLLQLVSSDGLLRTDSVYNTVSDGLTVLENALPILSSQLIIQLVLQPVMNNSVSEKDELEVPMCSLVKRLMSFQIMYTNGQILRRIAALLMQACWIVESKSPGQISTSVLNQLEPFFKIPSYSITSPEEEILYWDLVHILYTDLIVLVEPGVIRERISSWGVIERTLRGRFRWEPPPRQAMRLKAKESAKNVYDGIQSVYNQMYQGVSIRIPPAMQSTKPSNTKQTSDSYWKSGFPVVQSSLSRTASWQNIQNSESAIDWYGTLSQSGRWRNGLFAEPNGSFKSKWNLKAKIVHQWNAFSEQLRGLKVDENESLILTYGNSATANMMRQPSVKCWDVGGSQTFGNHTGHRYPVIQATFLDNSANQVASLDSNGFVHIWRSVGVSSEPIRKFVSLRQHRSPQPHTPRNNFPEQLSAIQSSIYTCMLGRCGTNSNYDLVMGSMNGQLSALDVEKGQVVATWSAIPHEHNVLRKISSLCSVSNSRYLSGSCCGYISLFDTRQDEMDCYWQGHAEHITQICLYNNYICSSSSDRTLKLWDIRKAGAKGLVLVYSGFLEGIGGFSIHDATAMVYSGSQIALLSVADMSQQQQLQTQNNQAVQLRGLDGLKEGGKIAALGALPYSRLIAVGFEDGSVKLCC